VERRMAEKLKKIEKIGKKILKISLRKIFKNFQKKFFEKKNEKKTKKLVLHCLLAGCAGVLILGSLPPWSGMSGLTDLSRLSGMSDLSGSFMSDLSGRPGSSRMSDLTGSTRWRGNYFRAGKNNFLGINSHLAARLAARWELISRVRRGPLRRPVRQQQ
jgi:hypothetical protein